MKKLIIAFAFALLSSIAYGQSLQKGNLVGVHVLKINLKPDVTYNQMHEFVTQKLYPAYEKNFGGKVYLTKCVRGENKYSYGMIYIYKSEGDRDKFWMADGGGLTELGNAAMEKVQPLMEEFTNEIGAFESEYNDWLVQ